MSTSDATKHNRFKKKRAARAKSSGGPASKRGRVGDGEQEDEEAPRREYRGVDNAGGGMWRAIIPSTRNPSVMRNLGVFPTVGSLVAARSE